MDDPSCSNSVPLTKKSSSLADATILRSLLAVQIKLLSVPWHGVLWWMNKTAVLLVRSLEACGATPDIVEASKRKGELSQEQVLAWMKREMVAKANEIKRLTDDLETCQTAKRRAVIKLQRAREDCATLKAELSEEQSHAHPSRGAAHALEPPPATPHQPVSQQIAVNLTRGLVHVSACVAAIFLWWACQQDLPSMEYKFLMVCSFVGFFIWLFNMLSTPRALISLMIFAMSWGFVGWAISVKLRGMGQ